ncbi:MAG: hypothetical protein OEZ65_15590 [Gemmatimonadota bacterium]|nr:hypothetical protein [Gemmatimonadota bacterium]MDH5760988.1 hypothetical protein [Gemmatimonadota bacterium]
MIGVVLFVRLLILQRRLRPYVVTGLRGQWGISLYDSLSPKWFSPDPVELRDAAALTRAGLFAMPVVAFVVVVASDLLCG